MGCSSSGINRETNRGIISVAVVPSKQKLFVQPKLKNNNVHLIRYITAVQDYAMHYMNAWLKRCHYQEGYSRVLPPLVDFAILGTTKSPELCSLGSGLDCSVIEY